MSDEFISHYCPICDGEIDPDRTSCPHCGERLICPDCGAPLDSPVSCWTCGAALSEEIHRDDLLRCSLGDRFAGGFVFYLDGSGGGLVAAPHDVEDAVHPWGDGYASIPTTKTFVGTGEANTRAIDAVAAPGSAAHRCSAMDCGGYADWFLPSRDELNLMYRRLHTRGIGAFAPAFYWSSSLRGTELWTQDFSSGLTFFAKPDDEMRIRAVRRIDRADAGNIDHPDPGEI